MEKDCQTCTYCLKSNSTATLRCGIEYYKLPAVLRKPMHLDHYPAIPQIRTCPSWVTRVTTVLGSIHCQPA
jgi:hypothetical protein